MRARRERYATLTRDGDRDRLLITGRNIATIFAHYHWIDRGARWSNAARGRVLPLREFDDVTAELERAHVPYRVRDRVEP